MFEWIRNKFFSSLDGASRFTRPGQPLTIQNRTQGEQMSLFSSIASDAEKVFDDIKAGIAKAVGEIPKVEAVVAKDAPEVIALAGVVSPSLAAFLTAKVPVANSLLEGVASVLSAGGQAAESTLLNAGLDSAVISSVKALIPTFEALA